MYEAFPEVLRLIRSVPYKVLQATREERWMERARQICDDSFSWTQCEKQWREAMEAAQAKSDLDLNLLKERYVQTCRI